MQAYEWWTDHVIVDGVYTDVLHILGVKEVIPMYVILIFFISHFDSNHSIIMTCLSKDIANQVLSTINDMYVIGKQ